MIKKILFISILVPFILCVLGFSSRKSSGECFIRNIYEEIEPESNTKVITSYGSIEDAELILVPTKFDIGKYKVRLIWKALNLYKIENTDYWVETQVCTEIPSWDPAILIITSNYGFTKGKIIF